MNAFQRIWQTNTPDFLLAFIRIIFEPKVFKVRRKALLKQYKNVEMSVLPIEIQHGIIYLSQNPFTPFPYKWTKKYDTLMPEVIRDERQGCFYTLFEGKKMYFPKHFTHTHVIWTIRSISKEQDQLSPHRYLTENFQLEPDSIVVDAGVAEGNFALSVVEKARKLYLIECNSSWMEALKLTFGPWKEKVFFIEKYLSDEASPSTTTIDSFLVPESGCNYFIKLDIEGFEQKAISGMKQLFASGNPIKMNVCTYHHPNDCEEILATLKSLGFFCEVSEGYLIYFQRNEEPSFRKALIRAQKKFFYTIKD